MAPGDWVVLEQPALRQRKQGIVVIDAGHGGKDTGALSKSNGYEEKRLTLATALQVRAFLEEMGYETLLTREQDTFVSLSHRAEFANTHRAALFVSIHFNFAPNAEAEGVEVFYYKDESKKRLSDSKRLGEAVMARVVRHTGASRRAVKPGNLAVIRETTMPAVLVEGGFLSNPVEREKVKDIAYRKYLAWGIAKGIDHYLQSAK